MATAILVNFVVTVRLSISVYIVAGHIGASFGLTDFIGKSSCFSENMYSKAVAAD